MSNKKRARLPLSAYLLYLLVATFIFTGVSFSKYATSTTSGDKTRIAIMEAGITTDTFTYNGYPGQRTSVSEAIPVTIVNYSTREENGVDSLVRVCEVTLKYTVSIDNVLCNIPLDFYVYSDPECKDLIAQSTDDVNGGAELEITGIFNASEPSEMECYIVMEWRDSEDDDEYGPEYSYELDVIRVSIKAEQVD